MRISTVPSLWTSHWQLLWCPDPRHVWYRHAETPFDRARAALATQVRFRLIVDQLGGSQQLFPVNLRGDPSGGGFSK